MGRKVGGGLLCPSRRAATPSNKCSLGQALLPYQVVSSSIQPFGHNRHELKTGGLCPFYGGAATHLTRSLGRVLPPYQVAYWSIQSFGRNRHGLKIGERGWVSIEHKVPLDEAYLHTKWHLNPSSHLATTDISRKLGAAPFGEEVGEVGPHLTQCGQGRGLPACQVSYWSIQLFGHNTPMSQADRTDNGSIA